MPTCTCESCRRLAAPPVLPTCYNCDASFTRYADTAGYYYCANCVAYCSGCDAEGASDDFTDGLCASCNRPACAVCGYRYDPDYGYGDTCSDCYEESQARYVHDYSYRPDPHFLKLPDDPDQTLFFGFELEAGSDEPEYLAERLYDRYGEESVLYCKNDSSVDGVEIVSHPMTHAYFSSAPFLRMFNDPALNVWDSQPAGHGLHIHVSRDGFKSQAHIMRWLLLFYKNSDNVSRLARRSSSQWAGFTDGNRCARKAKGSRMGDRYVAVNAQNAHTLEVRVFRSTWSEQELRAAMDFMHASVTYARTLTAHDVIRGDGLSWQRFRNWAAEREQYANLTAELDRLDGTDVPNDEEEEEDY